MPATTAAHVLAARDRHGVALHGPLAGNTSSQAQGALTLDAFTVDWEHRQVTCPGGVTATDWYPRNDSKGLPVIRVSPRPPLRPLPPPA